MKTKTIFRTIATLAIAICFQTTLIADQGISLASNYQKNSGLQWEWAMDSLMKFAFDPNDKVLDLGSGDGKITNWIANQVPHGIVVGMDISEKMIQYASLNYIKNNLLFLQGNAIAVPFVEQFDKVVSFNTLHWVLDQQRALESIKSCLKQNGTMLLILPGKSPSNLATVSERVANSEKWKAHFPAFKQERIYFSSDEYTLLLQKSGLEIRSITETPTLTFFKNRTALISWITPLVNFASHLPSDLQQDFIEDIADQMLSNAAPLSDGSIPIHHVKIEVVAVRV